MGLIAYKLNISYAALQVANPSTIIEDQKHLLLSVMPNGTEAVGIERLEDNHSSLSILYILTFSHPLFKDGSRIELDQTRVYWENESLIGNALIPGNVLTAIRYYDPDGKLMY